MIFNSPKMDVLRKKYENVPKSRIPQMALLDREPEFAEERQYLEEAFQVFPASSKRKLLGSLFSKRENQHIGAWFELIFYGWLRDAQIGEIIIEPELSGQTPDFVIDTGTQKIILEAWAHTKDNATRKKERVPWRPFVGITRNSVTLLNNV